jgi:hypothetical protein
MLILRHRLAIAGVITATAVAVPAVALASGSGSPPAKPAPPQASAASAAKSPAARSALTAPSGSAGISPSRLQAGLAAAKRAGGNTAAGLAAFAAATGTSRATAQEVLNGVFGTEASRQSPLGSPVAARAFAARLGVSQSAAGHALAQLAALSGKAGVDPASPAFAGIARDLGVSPARLAAALDAVKQSQAGH